MPLILFFGCWGWGELGMLGGKFMFSFYVKKFKLISMI